MPEHGTRTMYVHYKCRCEACCRAEHAQYLKRPEAKLRKRTYSKHGDIERPSKATTKGRQNKKRRNAIIKGSGENHKQIHWRDIADAFSMRCAICGCEIDPTDVWLNENGRPCQGRNYPTVDHIIPLRHGGTDTMENVQLTCKHCNSKKGAKVSA